VFQIDPLGLFNLISINLKQKILDTLVGFLSDQTNQVLTQAEPGHSGVRRYEQPGVPVIVRKIDDPRYF
jgi:hypothetical protein